MIARLDEIAFLFCSWTVLLLRSYSTHLNLTLHNDLAFISTPGAQIRSLQCRLVDDRLDKALPCILRIHITLSRLGRIWLLITFLFLTSSFSMKPFLPDILDDDESHPNLIKLTYLIEFSVTLCYLNNVLHAWPPLVLSIIILSKKKKKKDNNKLQVIKSPKT